MLNFKIRAIIIYVLISTSVYSQRTFSSVEWQEDLRFLQEKIHQEYSNLFHKITSNDFDKAVSNFYKKIPNLQDHEVKVGFAELVAKFGYGHTALSLYGWRYDEVKNMHQLPYQLYWFNDGIYIIATQKEYKEALGAKVHKIGKVPVIDALNRIKPVVSSENDQFFKDVGPHYLGVPEILHTKHIIDDLSNVTMTLEKDGKEFQLTFKPFKSDRFPGSYGFIRTEGNWISIAPDGPNTPLWLQGLKENGYTFNYIEKEKTVYVRQSTVFNERESIEQFYKRVFNFINDNDVNRLIIDLRLNGGGDNFNNKDVIIGLIQNEKINRKGSLYVVIGRKTFSAAQNLVNEIENYTEAIFVGEPTGENVNFYGDANFEVLPNSKLPIRLSWAWWQDKDPRDSRQWTEPQIAVNLNYADFVKGIDPVHQAINTSSYIENYYANHQLIDNIDEYIKSTKMFYSDSAYSFFNFEQKINIDGYELVGANKNTDALRLFELNAELHPASQNVWDSLAESYWRIGNTTKAIEYYEKSIEMSPESQIANNSRKMLNEIKLQSKN